MELELLRANLVRTLVPVLVGAVVTTVPLLADDQGKAALYPLVAAAVTWFYYAAVRIGETRYPQLGRLLGRPMVRPVASTPAGTPAGTQAGASASGPSAQVALAGGGRPVGVRLGGVAVEGVESLELTTGEGRPTLLTLRIRDPHVELGSPR